MPNQITISGITGTPPYLVYVCDQTITYCYIVQTISGSSVSFTVPYSLESTTPIILKIIDSNDCEIIQLLSCGEIYGKQFEGFEIFLFQDTNIYLFEGP
jgi:hypothetical protein